MTAASASTGVIMSAAAASARCSVAGRRSGAGGGDQVTVTDSHHPALRMVPDASSRRQCPRDSCTCCCQSPRLSGSRERLEASCMYTLCARLVSVVTGDLVWRLFGLGGRHVPEMGDGPGAFLGDPVYAALSLYFPGVRVRAGCFAASGAAGTMFAMSEAGCLGHRGVRLGDRQHGIWI